MPRVVITVAVLLAGCAGSGERMNEFATGGVTWELGFRKAGFSDPSVDRSGPLAAARAAVEQAALEFELVTIGAAPSPELLLVADKNRTLHMRARHSSRGAAVQLWGSRDDLEAVAARVDALVEQAMSIWCETMGPGYKSHIRRLEIQPR